ncbi:hypothetical protein ACVW1C_008109 [Bradyrhizobium sp. USDA 4011]
MGSSNDAWEAFCDFGKRGLTDGEYRERWDIKTFPPKKKRVRKRSVTLARAMRQANEAGLAVSSATLNADGSVTLTFGEPVSRTGGQSNEWDTVQ